MAISLGNEASGLGHLHHHGTISPDGSVSLDNSVEGTSVADITDPYSASSQSLVTIAPPLLGDETSTSDAAGSATSAAQIQSTSPSGFVIIADYDSSITNLESSSLTLYAQVTGAIGAAIQFYESHITNSMTITLDFGFGEVDNQTLGSDDLGESEGNDSTVGYSTLLTALSNHVTMADDQGAAATLPATNPVGNGIWKVDYAEQKALGLMSATGSEVDGYVGLSSTLPLAYNPSDLAVAGSYDAVGVLEHEMSEDMGRVQSLGTYEGKHVYEPLDLYRYSAPGTPDLTPGPGYFSVDGGQTNLDEYNNPTDGGDAGDWATSVPDDSYDAYSNSGVVNVVSATDLREMDVLGYDIACYAAGTRILTARGEVCVEDLAVGDLVRARFAGLAPIEWIGRRRIDSAGHPAPLRVWPVRIAAGAFEPGMPHRDLLLSPDHAVFVDGVLIPIHRLVNGASVRREAVRGQVTYYHVELPAHDVLVADGMPAESYLDTGNRNMFEAGTAVVLQPDRGPTADSVWTSHACARLVEGGAILAAVRERLAQRARGLGHDVPDETTFHILASGTAELQVAGATGILRILCAARREGADRRVLGALIRAIRIDGVPIALDDPRLASGLHEVEQHGKHRVRWTDGEAVFAIGTGRAARRIEIDVAALATPISRAA